MSKRILALDLATKTGWARNYGPEPRSGVVKFKGKTRGERFEELIDWLRQFNKVIYMAELTVFETPHMRGGDATRSCVGMVAMIEYFASLNGLQTDEYRPDAIKRFATGTAKASKEQMIEAARKLGYNPKDDNESDAIHLLRLAESQGGGDGHS